MVKIVLRAFENRHLFPPSGKKCCKIQLNEIQNQIVSYWSMEVQPLGISFVIEKIHLHLYGTKVHCNLATCKLTNWTLIYSLGLNPKKQSVKVSYTYLPLENEIIWKGGCCQIVLLMIQKRHAGVILLLISEFWIIFLTPLSKLPILWSSMSSSAKQRS